MKSILKRYGVALIALIFVFGTMIFATIGVRNFSNMMVKDANITDTIKPRGENLIK